MRVSSCFLLCLLSVSLASGIVITEVPEMKGPSNATEHADSSSVAFMTVGPKPAPTLAPTEAPTQAPTLAPTLAPKTAPVVVSPDPVVVSPTPAVAPTVKSVSDEIASAHLNSVSGMSKLQERIFKIITETGIEQRKFEEQSKNTYDDANQDLKVTIDKLKLTKEIMAEVQNDVTALNATIHRHYLRLIHDSAYFHSLELLKPTFLKSLEDVGSKVGNIRDTVSQKIRKDRYKIEMMTLLSKIHFNTVNITGYVASEFMDHYNKYKLRVSKDNLLYKEDEKKMEKLVADYRLQAQKVKDMTSEYERIVVIVKKLKATYDASASENADLDELVKRVLTLMKSKNCVA